MIPARALSGQSWVESLVGGVGCVAWVMFRPRGGVAGHGVEGGRDFLEAGFDVGGGCWSGRVGVSGVGAGNAVTEVSFGSAARIGDSF
jgi:hypothetical protein